MQNKSSRIFPFTSHGLFNERSYVSGCSCCSRLSRSSFWRGRSMSIKKISSIQPESFEFSKDNLLETENEIKKYPKDRKASAVLALLYLVQKQNDNWIPLAAIKYVAKLLGISYMQVYEVSTFYSMFNLSPVGKYFVQVCTTTPCMIRGSKKNCRYL